MTPTAGVHTGGPSRASRIVAAAVVFDAVLCSAPEAAAEPAAFSDYEQIERLRREIGARAAR